MGDIQGRGRGGRREGEEVDGGRREGEEVEGAGGGAAVRSTQGSDLGRFVAQRSSAEF